MKFFKKSFKTVYHGYNGEEGYTLYKRHRPDFILTDIKMPGACGMELAKKIRLLDKEKPIAFLTAHTDSDYLLEAIELQPIKYFVKPAPAKELLRYFEAAAQECAPVIAALGDMIRYDRMNRTILAPDAVYTLTKMESELLSLLLKKKNYVVTYDEIDKLWGDKFMSVNSLRTLIKNIRHATYPGLIDNLPNIGYRMNIPEVQA
jgi:DNA-binding response OmpR family regulator